MKKSFFAEIFLLSSLSILLVLLLNPFNIIMKLMISAGFLTLLIILYIAKFIIIWREKPQDERDVEHRFYSSWVSYAVTSVLLFTGVVVESIQGNVDIWLIIALTGLFLSKLSSLIYLEIYK